MQLSKPSNKARQRRPRTGPAESAAALSPSPHPNPTQPRMPPPGNAVPPPETASRRRELPFFARLAAINLLLVMSFSEIQICQWRPRTRRYGPPHWQVICKWQIYTIYKQRSASLWRLGARAKDGARTHYIYLKLCKNTADNSFGILWRMSDVIYECLGKVIAVSSSS